METVEQIRDRLLVAFGDAKISVLSNPSPSAQHSILVDAAHAVAIASFLRDDPTLRLDQCSNATGVDWPDKEIVETVKPAAPQVTEAPAVPAKVPEQKTTRIEPGYFEVVYHLYSITHRHGPVILRTRTANRNENVSVPSLTPVWRSCEFQEREIFDLFGVVFTGHPDLRRILMWDGFTDHPMRRDYVEPDDYEWEPTPHGTVLEKTKRHYPAPTTSPVPAPIATPPSAPP